MSLVLAFTYGAKIKVGDSKKSHWNVFEKGMSIDMTTWVRLLSSASYHILLAKLQGPMKLQGLEQAISSKIVFSHLA